MHINKKIIALLHSIKRILFGLLLFGIIFSLLVNTGTTSIYTNDIQKARDTFVMTDVMNIKKSLEKDKEFKFLSLKEYELEFNVDINPPKKCYYLSSTEKNDSYILVIPLESSKFKKKYGNDYYLYNSNSNYIIDEIRFKEIKNIIDFPCKE